MSLFDPVNIFDVAAYLDEVGMPFPVDIEGWHAAEVAKAIDDDVFEQIMAAQR